MDKIRVSAKTKDEAITKALIQLGITSDRLDYTVLVEGKSGLFGIGAKPWIIEASVKAASQKSELERLEKEKQKWEAEIRRSTGMLNNERFTSKAPAEKVEEEREKLQRNTQLLQQVTERLAALRK